MSQKCRNYYERKRAMLFIDVDSVPRHILKKFVSEFKVNNMNWVNLIISTRVSVNYWNKKTKHIIIVLQKIRRRKMAKLIESNEY